MDKVLSRVDTTQEFQKEDFERMLDAIILQIVKNRGLDVNQVAIATPTVVASMTEYGEMPEEMKGWESLVAFLYVKYHQVLDIDISVFQPRS